MSPIAARLFAPAGARVIVSLILTLIGMLAPKVGSPRSNLISLATFMNRLRILSSCSADLDASSLKSENPGTSARVK